MRRNIVVKKLLLLREWFFSHCCACMLVRAMHDEDVRGKGLAGLARAVLDSKNAPACNGARALAQHILREQK